MVRRLGYAEDPLVAALLRQASAVGYPSLDEGFGFPALEAMACGSPLVTTEGTAMAEVAAGAAVLVPGGRPDALACALESILDGDPSEMISCGLELASRYTWRRTADSHADAYRLAVQRHRAG
jgi:glycosyltransferase involved in cell wall biosynthesis